MADKGFAIQDELASVGAQPTLPHFMKGEPNSLQNKRLITTKR